MHVCKRIEERLYFNENICLFMQAFMFHTGRETFDTQYYADHLTSIRVLVFKIITFSFILIIIDICLLLDMVVDIHFNGSKRALHGKKLIKIRTCLVHVHIMTNQHLLSSNYLAYYFSYDGKMTFYTYLCKKHIFASRTRMCVNERCSSKPSMNKLGN